MTDQELHDTRRAELLSGIQAALSGSSVPAAPKDPGPDATQAQKAEFEAAQRDYGVLKTLGKSTGDVTPEERAELLRQVRDCAQRGWE